MIAVVGLVGVVIAAMVLSVACCLVLAHSAGDVEPLGLPAPRCDQRTLRPSPGSVSARHLADGSLAS